MKQKNSGLTAILFAFLTILIGWLIQNHFADLLGMWKQAKARVTPEEPQQTFVTKTTDTDEPVQ